MKKVFLVERVDSGYDEYVSCVIIADSIEKVNAIIDSENESWRNMDHERAHYLDDGILDRIITEIDLENETDRILHSFYHYAQKEEL